MRNLVGRSVSVSGRVQGVFFRQWTVEQARELGVSGWIRNCPNGSVEAHLSGEEQAVGLLVERMRRGSPGAHVAQLTVEEVPPESGERFEVHCD